MSKKQQAAKKKPGDSATPGEQGSEGFSIPTVVLGLTVVVLGIVAYSNSLASAFVFDDRLWIEDGSRIRQDLWPLTPFFTGTLRPLLFYTLALNYQIGGTGVTGYHVFNISIHLLSALVLFGLVRRTLLQPCFAGRFEGSAKWYAFVIAAIWVVHPLQTQGVNYVIQRCESMFSLFLLLAMYGMVRGSQSPRPWCWYLLTVVSVWLGVGAKPIMIVAPVVMYLYDRTFLSIRWSGPIRRHWWLYLAIAPAWLWLALGAMPSIAVAINSHQVMATSSSHQSGDPQTPSLAQESPTDSVDGTPERKRPSSFEYARTQPEVLLHYLRLVLFPNPLCLDYMWPIADTKSAILPTLLILALIGISVWALFVYPAIGFVACSFFIVLAPTCSILPIIDLAFEHRMYLASAAVIVTLVFGIRWLLEFLINRTTWPVGLLNKLSMLVCGVALVMLLVGTTFRNRDYRSEISIWESVHRVRPNNLRAINNLAQLYLDDGRRDEALAMLRLANQQKKGNTQTLAITGMMLLQDGKPAEAIKVLEIAVRGMPTSAQVHIGLGAGYERMGKLEDAIRHFQRAVELEPGNKIAYKNLGHSLVSRGTTDAGIEALKKAVQLDNKFYDAHVNLGAAFGKTGQIDLAIRHFEAAASLPSDDVTALDNLATAYASVQRYADAVRAAQRALERAQRVNDWKLVAELQTRIGQYEAQLQNGGP